MLSQALKRRVLELLDSVQPESRYKVLVVDRTVKQLLDIVVDKAELLNRQVANVLLLDESRPTEGYLEAVYIVEQSSFSFGCIQADFVRVPHRYAAAHIFLLPRLRASMSALQRFQNSSISRYIRHIGPAPLAFLALEERVFSLGVLDANTILYNQACKDLALELVDLTGRQLADVCETLQVAPYIRYSTRWQVTRANAYPALVARAAAQHIETARTRYMSPALEAESRPTLLILDRTTDLTAPLRHEFGLQSMALDVLDKQFKPRNTLREFTPSSEGSETHTLSDKETAWVDLRHKHIVVVTEELNARIRDLRATNPHLANPSTDVSVGDVRNMLAALPEFMKERESVALTLDMALECMAAVEKLHLKDVAEFEQAVTLGTTSDGAVRPEVRLADSLVAILAHKSVDRDMKIRALALYAVYRGGIRRQDYERLQRHARLQDEDIAAVQALSYLGTPLTYLGATVDKLPQPLTREHEDQPLLYSRVQTGLQTVVEQLIAGTLDSATYPYAGDAPDSTQEALNVATSLRNPRQRATWAQNVTSTPSASSRSSGELKKSKKRMLVFVIGGFTASEAQAAYHISDRSAFSVILGGHDMLTPSKYLGFLRMLQSPREELHLRVDQPDPAVPEFLSASDRQNRQPSPAKPTAAPQNGMPTYSTPATHKSKPAGQQLTLSTKTSSKTRGQAPITPTTYLNEPVNLTLGNASSQFTEQVPSKEKKDMKHRLKGAFKLKK